MKNKLIDNHNDLIDFIDLYRNIRWKLSRISCIYHNEKNTKKVVENVLLELDKFYDNHKDLFYKE